MPDQTLDTDKPRHRRRKDARPGEIVEAGLKEFAKAGFAAARLEDIAKRAGVSKGTIYLYFDNKEALFQDVVRMHVLPLINRDEALLDAFEGSTHDLIILIIRDMYSKMVNSDLRAIIQIILAEGPKFPHLLEFYHDEVILKGMDILKRLIARGRARGEIPESRLEGNALVLVGPILTAAIWKWSFERFDPMDLDAYIDAHLEMVLAGLGMDGHDVGAAQA